MAGKGTEMARRLTAELAGTFALTLVAAGGEVVAAVSGGEVDHTARAVAPGLLVMAMIYAVGDISGAHFNPAVTLGFASRGVFPWRRVPGYWLVQVTGALLAAALLRGLFGGAGHVGATTPHDGLRTGLIVEAVLTWLLVTVILGTASRKGLVGTNAALAVGGAIALCGLFAGPISGASMNPARSLGPAIVAGATDDVWIYVAGPFAGALLAVLLTRAMRGHPDREEEETASGDEQSGGDGAEGGKRR